VGQLPLGEPTGAAVIIEPSKGGLVKPSLYRVDTRAISVEVSFGAGALFAGEMFLRPSIVTLSGIESLADRLNDRDAFFPLREDTLILGKSQVRWVCADVSTQTDVLRVEGASDALSFPMAVELDDGHELSGTFHAVLPQGKRRALDFINDQDGLFVDFHVASRLYVINRAFIRRLRDASPR
jgi:hypothetical protein